MLYYIGEVDLEPRSQRWSKLELGEIGVLFCCGSHYTMAVKRSQAFAAKKLLFFLILQKNAISQV